MAARPRVAPREFCATFLHFCSPSAGPASQLISRSYGLHTSTVARPFAGKLRGRMPGSAADRRTPQSSRSSWLSNRKRSPSRMPHPPSGSRFCTAPISSRHCTRMLTKQRPRIRPCSGSLCIRCLRSRTRFSSNLRAYYLNLLTRNPYGCAQHLSLRSGDTSNACRQLIGIMAVISWRTKAVEPPSPGGIGNRV